MIQFLIIFTIFVFGILLFIIFNLNNQVKQLEDEIQKFNEKEKYLNDELINNYEVFLNIFTDAYTTLIRIDKKGSFSSDDEVGFTFKILMTTIETVKDKLINLKVESE